MRSILILAAYAAAALAQQVHITSPVPNAKISSKGNFTVDLHRDVRASCSTCQVLHLLCIELADLSPRERHCDRLPHLLARRAQRSVPLVHSRARAALRPIQRLIHARVHGRSSRARIPPRVHIQGKSAEQGRERDRRRTFHRCRRKSSVRFVGQI